MRVESDNFWKVLEGEEEGAQPHDGEAGADPDWLGASTTTSQVTHRQQEDEGGDVVTVGDEPGLRGADPEPGEHRI